MTNKDFDTSVEISAEAILDVAHNAILNKITIVKPKDHP